MIDVNMKPTFICSDWRSLGKELRKQLKPYGLTVKFKTYKDDNVVKVKISECEELIFHNRYGVYHP